MLDNKTSNEKSQTTNEAEVGSDHLIQLSCDDLPLGGRGFFPVNPKQYRRNDRSRICAEP